MTISPCKDCDNKGCGSYHDQCEAYQKFLKSKKVARDNERKSKLYHYVPYQLYHN